MGGFFKTYFWQLLKIVFAVAGVIIGFFVPLYASVQTFTPPKILLEFLLILFSVTGFLVGVMLPFVVEYRGQLTVRKYLGEVLVNLIALLIVGGSSFAGIALGVMGVNSFVTYDGTGLAVIFFLGSGAVLGSIPGILLAALATTIWKLRKNRQTNLS